MIEVNPRLTVSYIGLKRAMDFNPAQAIIDAVTGQKLSENVKQRGYSFFSKVQVPFCTNMLAKTYKLENVVSPPFPVEENKPAYALVAASADSCSGAQSAYVHSKKRLLKLCGDD